MVFFLFYHWLDEIRENDIEICCIHSKMMIFTCEKCVRKFVFKKKVCTPVQLDWLVVLCSKKYLVDMWNAYERLFDGNSVNWVFFVHAACVPPCSVYLLYSSWPHQPYYSAQCNTSATGPIEQTSRYQRKSLCVPKLLCQMRAFMISSDIFCFEITLSKQITDTFASIYIRHSNTHTHPFWQFDI